MAGNPEAATQAHSNSEAELNNAPSKFQPQDCSNAAPKIALPDEIWVTVLESPCTFPPSLFEVVMLNLIKNPNISSSLLFRADILYDSGESADLKNNGQSNGVEHHVEPTNMPDYSLLRSMIRKLIPRNPQLDRPIRQTCYFFHKVEQHAEHNIVMYVPHVDRPEDMPFYHPAVAKLAFQHTWDHSANTGMVSLSYSLFSGTTLSTKLERTALKLLQTIHKHGQGQLAGYEKRVHLDRIIPQKRYQDTYAELKAKYGRQLSEQWVEVTDPGKHVFEDIGIAAYLIELWRDMYLPPSRNASQPANTSSSKPPFPGFLDLGCGNGLLTHILLTTGYPGTGIDARARKTWSIYPQPTHSNLHQRLLVPQILQPLTTSTTKTWHNGLLPPGTFIISNHADELTAWTPLLAYLNDSAFLAIPCCSHDLSGARFRAPAATKGGGRQPAAVPRLPQQQQQEEELKGAEKVVTGKQVPETGSLKCTEAQKKMPSAYSSLCSYVTSLAEDVGFEAERDVLRIPSTRNQCILGRRRRGGDVSPDLATKQQDVAAIVEAELNKSIVVVGAEWIERAAKLSRKPASGH
ncbi:DUF1613-domain-containing protein [Teratosphaeria nubilosa]|uniref:tRNA (uracil-O(2)-)-methyltransferase n=1 Tax=Teratosphaeria nubilosa TaxID=161662 RepID=A0A6G1KT61_9PEZI|nr:DUF1613-domain-containing protein [Teratosphaeria nubilosa]